MDTSNEIRRTCNLLVTHYALPLLRARPQLSSCNVLRTMKSPTPKLADSSTTSGRVSSSFPKMPLLPRAATRFHRVIWFTTLPNNVSRRSHQLMVMTRSRSPTHRSKRMPRNLLRKSLKKLLKKSPRKPGKQFNEHSQCS